MNRLLLTILIIPLFVACGDTDGRPDGSIDSSSVARLPPEAIDSSSARRATSDGGEAARWDSLPQIVTAPDSIAADTIPLRAPDGSPARYGIPSGRLFGRFTGDARGTRTIVFDQWGLRERKEENIAPYPETKSVAINNTIFITTTDAQSYADMRTRRGFRRAINGLGSYQNDPESKSISFGEWIARRTEAKRLPDTTIAGYHTRVYQRMKDGATTTIWVWRGITIREQIEVPAQGVRYLFEPLSIEVGVQTGDATFEFPKGYEISPFH